MRRAIVLVLDGLRRDSVTPGAMPALHALSRRGTWFGAHRSVFPSVTRCCSAALATGCHPGRNGLQANTVALEENGRLVERDAGEPDFLDRKRAATGTTLDVPTLADRVAGVEGGLAMFSNVSPGACRAHDPNGVALVRNRAVAWNGADPRPLGTAGDGAGDEEVVRRFIAEGVDGSFAVAMCWCAEPDHMQHHAPLGSPAVADVLRGADRRVAAVAAAVEARRARGEEVLFLVASDHGHDTVEAVVDVNAALEAAGVRRGSGDDGLLAVANGNTAMLYALPGREAEAARALDVLRGQDWAGTVLDKAALRAHGQEPRHHLFGAVALRTRDDANQFGVPGMCITVRPGRGKPDHMGFGTHGAFGIGEQGPTLLASGPGFPAEETTRPSSLVDIAPTILAHLGLPAAGMDGRPLQHHPQAPETAA